MKKAYIKIIFISSLLLSGCIVGKRKTGVQNFWRDEAIQRFKEGETKQTEVLKVLGPPSQIINLKNQLVYYYLLEREDKKGVILIVYNYDNVKVKYDRAIFFFNKEGVLEEYSYSIEQISYEVEKKK
jgi:outer membrane protein assembly factor BamE (lipoprotein component of BamABCDE complex)